MAQPSKRSYHRRNADEQIQELQLKIKEIQRREKVRVKKIMDKKYTMIGQALVNALNDGHISITTFTLILSKYVTRPDDLKSIAEDFDLDDEVLNPKEAKKSRTSRSTTRKPKAKVKAKAAPAKTAKQDKATKAPASDKKASGSTPLALPETKTPEASEEEIEQAAQELVEIDNKRAEEEAVQAAQDQQEQDEFDAAVENEVQGNIVDPSLRLEDVDNFARRGRLIDRLRSSEIHTLRDLITKTEVNFAKIPGISTGTVRTCKAILNEMKLSFKS